MSSCESNRQPVKVYPYDNYRNSMVKVVVLKIKITHQELVKK